MRASEDMMSSRRHSTLPREFISQRVAECISQLVAECISQLVAHSPAATRPCEAGPHLRLVDLCITQL